MWETGDDIIPRAPASPAARRPRPRSTSSCSVRDYLNEGGKLLLTRASTPRSRRRQRRTTTTRSQPPECTTPATYPCLPLLNDFLQYWLGAYVYVDDGGTDADGRAVPAGRHRRTRSTASPATLNGRARRENQDHTALSFLTTSSFLPPDEFPQFASALRWTGTRRARPVRPAHRRAGTSTAERPTSLQAADPHRRPDRRHVGRAALLDLLRHRGGLGLPVRRGARGRAPTTGRRCRTPTATPQHGTGESCAEGWVNELHPFLAHYQNDGTARRPAPPATGTRPPARRTAGRSGRSTCPRYAGQQVEVSISYVSDWGTQGIGVFLDDVTVSADGAAVARPRSRPISAAGPWPAPDGLRRQRQRLDPHPARVRRGRGGHDRGPCTSNSAGGLHLERAYFGFGLRKAVTSAEERNATDPGARSRDLRLPPGCPSRHADNRD